MNTNEIPTPRTDSFKKKWPDSRRHNWPCMFESEAFCEIEKLERELAVEKALAEGRLFLLNTQEARHQQELAEARMEAETLAKSIHRAEYSHVENWQPLDTVAGVISQIDNMYAGVREQRDKLAEALRDVMEHVPWTKRKQAYAALAAVKGGQA